MIGYIQAEDVSTWVARIDRWIRALVRAGSADWRTDDRLQLNRHDPGLKLAVLSSQHGRGAGLEPISLSHLWIEI
jgi:hypothetical protein